MTITSKDQLITFVNQGHTVDYMLFWGHREKNASISKSCLSQWYEASFVEGGQLFMTAEHYMMYHKAKLFGDHNACADVLQADNPSEAKAIGRRVKNFDTKIWDERSVEIVINANVAKFSQNPKLGAFLLDTKDSILVEASPVDIIWGIGLTQDDPAAQNPNQWRGRNLLGFALMTVRKQLRRAAIQ